MSLKERIEKLETRFDWKLFFTTSVFSLVLIWGLLPSMTSIPNEVFEGSWECIEEQGEEVAFCVMSMSEAPFVDNSTLFVCDNQDTGCNWLGAISICRESCVKEAWIREVDSR